MADPARDRRERSGLSGPDYVHALELETIVWLPDGHLTQLLDPSADRWRDA
jgi:hypothetical protein